MENHYSFWKNPKIVPNFNCYFSFLKGQLKKSQKLYNISAIGLSPVRRSVKIMSWSEPMFFTEISLSEHSRISVNISLFHTPFKNKRLITTERVVKPEESKGKSGMKQIREIERKSRTRKSYKII